MVDVDNGFYKVKFDLPEDKEKVVSEGHWMIFDHYLAVSHWSLEFISPKEKVDRTMVWIRFLGDLIWFIMMKASCLSWKQLLGDQSRWIKIP